MPKALLQMKLVKKVAPITGAFGIVSDVASPVVEFSNKLPFKGLVDVLTALLAVASVSLAFYWFMVVKKRLKENEDSMIPEILTTCLIATLVFSFFSFGQIITGSKKKGVVAAVVPGVESLQKSLFKIEANQKEMKTKLTNIEEQIEKIEKIYTIEDLEKLADQEYWDEVIAHLDDVKALERDERWQTVLESSVTGWMESLVNKEDTEKAYLDSSDVYNRFKTLKKSNEAMKLKETIGMNYIKTCLQAKPLKNCVPVSTEFINYDKKRKADLAIKVGNLTSYWRNIRFASTYYVMALDVPDSTEKLCGDDRLPAVVQNGVYAYYPEEKERAKKLYDACPEQVTKYALARIEKLSVNNVGLKDVCKSLDGRVDKLPAKCAKAK
ncbi:MAG: hypothetical protein HRT45_03935 [Bdellovibrionales bacterium]|nr:hypothetical protein [Bdellovibrionales bacterium]